MRRFLLAMTLFVPPLAAITELGTADASSSQVEVTIDFPIGAVGRTATAQHEYVSTETCQPSNAGFDDSPPEPPCYRDALRAAVRLKPDLEFGIGLPSTVAAVGLCTAGLASRLNGRQRSPHVTGAY